MRYDCYQFGGTVFLATLMLVHVCANRDIQHKQQYATNITCTEVREKKAMVIRNLIFFCVCVGGGGRGGGGL